MTAAVIARGQLERWTENRAHNLKTEKRVGESMEEYTHRVWLLHPLNFLGLEIASGDTVEVCGEEVNPRLVMRGLNRVIHGEQHIAAISWANEGYADLSEDAIAAVHLVTDALLLSVDQLTICISTLLQEQGKHDDATFVRMRPHVPLVALTPLSESLWPANLLLIQEGGADKVAVEAAKYEAVHNGARPAGRLYNDAEMMLLCFAHYRARSLQHASLAFDAESQIVGPLTQNDLSGSELPPVLVSEMAAKLASWLPDGSPARAAATTIADALRGSYWLWLEDDLRSMATVRVVLEQSARLRVWRLKPKYGSDLELLSNPSRWLARAGWGRLSALNRALGEFSHFRPDVKWGPAFELLKLLNPDATPETAPHTARRNALEVVTRLAAREICDQVRVLDPEVANAFSTIASEILAGGPEVDARLDSFLNHSFGFKSYELPADNWVRSSHAAKMAIPVTAAAQASDPAVPVDGVEDSPT
ncbi:hypothetical protein ACTAQI_00485 [Pseudarthrobacter sp. alpha12b]